MKDKIIGYELIIPSFCDSNKDGIGDLLGVVSKLDYLKELGINCIWLSPFHPSPKIDDGYDVSDYYAVDSNYGCLDDLKVLVKEAHQRGIMVIMDLVLNHTASKNKWFEASCQGIKPYDEYYIWKEQPNNWLNFLGESAWSYNEERGCFYFHLFTKGQPDLNYTCPLVIEEMAKVANFYLEIGIDGFRLDAVAHLSKDMRFKDSELCSKGELDTKLFSNRSEVIEYLKTWKSFLNKDCLLIGEVGGEVSPKQALDYLNKRDGVLDYAFTFDHCWLNGMYGKVVRNKWEDYTKVNTAWFVDGINRYDAMYQDEVKPIWYWLNHDHPRLINQYGSFKDKEASLRMLATLMYFLYGSFFIYYGEEIGMRNDVKRSIEEFRDVEAINFYHSSKFTKQEKLYHLNRMNREVARGKFDEEEALRQKKNENSLWSFYQKIFAFRRLHEELMESRNVKFIEVSKSVIHYQRVSDSEQLDVIVNVGSKGARFHKCTYNSGEFIVGNKWKGSFLPRYYYGVYYSKR